jgi:DNA primase
MSVIDEVKLKLDIMQVVSEYVKLQKAGRNYKSVCPFHSEKDPSFFVFPDRQSWHCFGACGMGGDIFSFIMKKEGVDFGQALRLLAAKAGVALIEQTSPKREAESRERESLFEINEAAAAYFHHLLLNTSSAANAMNYITGRGISTDTIKEFQIGYAPEGWDTIKQFLQGKGCPEAELLIAGLLVEGENKKSYDRFRNRLMFPIRNIQGKVTGFGGRALDDSLPKYLNSPQTPVFDKSGSLYGIDRAKTYIRQQDRAVIVEGYMDVLAAHQYGYKNVVASMGTAMSDKQLAILKGLTRNLVLALDADTAGEDAVSRSGEMVDKMLPVPPSFYGWIKYEDAHKAEVKILILPPGKDPDEVIMEDSARWPKIIADAKPMVDFIFESAVAKLNPESARDKSTVVEKLLPLLNEMKDPIRQAHYLERLSRLLKVDEHVLSDTLRKFKATERKRRGAASVKSSSIASPMVASSSPLEQYCLALLFQYPELKVDCKELTSEHFVNTENRELFDKWQLCNNPALLKDNLDVSLLEHLNKLISREFPSVLTENESVRRETMQECVVRLEERRLRNLESQKQELLAIEAAIGGTAGQLAKLEEGLEIPKQLRDIFIKQNNRHRQIKSEG